MTSQSNRSVLRRAQPIFVVVGQRGERGERGKGKERKNKEQNKYDQSIIKQSLLPPPFLPPSLLLLSLVSYLPLSKMHLGSIGAYVNVGLPAATSAVGSTIFVGCGTRRT